MPMGGETPGPRHLIPILPYLAFLCVFALNSKSSSLKGIFVGLGVFSIAVALIATVTDPHAPAMIDIPSTEYFLPLAFNMVFRPTWLDLLLKTKIYLCWIPSCLVVLFLILAAHSRLKKTENENIENRRVEISFSTTAISVLLAASILAASSAALYSRNLDQKHYSLGAALRENHNDAAATEELKNALIYNPGFFLAHFKLGLYEAERGNINGAIDHLERTVSLNPDMYNAHYNLGVIYMKVGKNNDALEHFSATVRSRNPTDDQIKISSYMKMAEIYVKLNEREKAAEMLDLSGKVFRPGLK